MLKVLVFLVVIFSFSYTLELVDDPAFKKIYEQDQNKNRVVLLFYSAKTCPQCAYMKQKVFEEPQVKEYLQKHFVVLQKDINKDDLPSGFEYFGIPTMFFVTKDGNKIGKIVGSSRANIFLKNLENIAHKVQ